METLAELPFIGDQVGLFSHDQAARSGPNRWGTGVHSFTQASRSPAPR